jgi:hypothetical protein
MDKLRCPKCQTAIPDSAVRSRAGSLASRARREKKGGRPAVLAPCPGCGQVLAGRARKTHLCPNARKPGRPRKVLQTLSK